ncbi:MAG TPA: aminodeoxychorismate synthase component I [Conexibacter sp.]|jgi:para-aminobenzoate synthetase|nr:aminodeoxychorismate synthase component I [Conexibacter sp.]
MRFVLVDNYDSFTFNLFQLLADLNGEPPLVLRNDDPVSWPALRAQGYGAIVISPGPGRPERPRDFGISASAIRDSGMAVLGVCLGHQGLCHLHGAPILPAPEPMHGRTSTVHHAQIDLFEGIPSPFEVVRYHSLVVGELPAGLHALAWSEDGVLMGVRHLEAPQWGVQFHPESICSEHGARLLRNFRDLALAASTRSRARLRGDEQRLVRRQPIVRYRTLALALDPEAAFAALYGEREVAFWLDSSAPGDGDKNARFSFMGDDRGPLAEVLTYDVASRRVTIRTASGVEQADGPLLGYLDDQVRARRTTTSALPFAFNGGYVGYLGYELKAECGGEAAHRADAPDAAFVLADRFLAFDHEAGDVWLVALEAHDAPAAPWLDEMSARLTQLASGGNGNSDGAAGDGRVRVPAHADGGRAVEVESAWPAGCAPRHDDDAYLALVERCQEAITAGETYEVCLTNAVAVEGAIDPWRVYRRLRRVNPAPFAAFLRFPEVSVLSASPERFLRVEADGAVEAKPIKGTAPRGATVEQDLAIRERLRVSEKDRAENLMIVDLLRNDLGAVCEVGSVHVPVLFGVESFATVHQLVSTIRGRIGRGASALDVVRAAFPGGSMTGAPKRRTMEIVDELEAGPRGVYSGALGWFALGGAADLSIVIRTIVVTEQGASFGAGGAIVSLSDPREELREVRLKARALVETLLPAEVRDRAEAPDPASAATNGLAIDRKAVK